MNIFQLFLRDYKQEKDRIKECINSDKEFHCTLIWKQPCLYDDMSLTSSPRLNVGLSWSMTCAYYEIALLCLTSVCWCVKERLLLLTSYASRWPISSEQNQQGCLFNMPAVACKNLWIQCFCLQKGTLLPHLNTKNESFAIVFFSVEHLGFSFNSCLTTEDIMF